MACYEVQRLTKNGMFLRMWPFNKKSEIRITISVDEYIVENDNYDFDNHQFFIDTSHDPEIFNDVYEMISKTLDLYKQHDKQQREKQEYEEYQRLTRKFGKLK